MIEQLLYDTHRWHLYNTRRVHRRLRRGGAVPEDSDRRRIRLRLKNNGERKGRETNISPSMGTTPDRGSYRKTLEDDDKKRPQQKYNNATAKHTIVYSFRFQFVLVRAKFV